jgi:hypothetical protein
MPRREREKRGMMLTQQSTHAREGRSTDRVRGSQRDNTVSTINNSDTRDNRMAERGRERRHKSSDGSNGVLFSREREQRIKREEYPMWH